MQEGRPETEWVSHGYAPWCPSMYKHRYREGHTHSLTVLVFSDSLPNCSDSSHSIQKPEAYHPKTPAYVPHSSPGITHTLLLGVQRLSAGPTARVLPFTLPMPLARPLPLGALLCGIRPWPVAWPSSLAPGTPDSLCDSGQVWTLDSA